MPIQRYEVNLKDLLIVSAPAGSDGVKSVTATSKVGDFTVVITGTAMDWDTIKMALSI